MRILNQRCAFQACSIQGGIAQLAGRKDEDTVACVPSFTGLAGDDYWGVFDGHRGEDLAQHAAETLHSHLATALEGASPVPAFADAFLRCHRAAKEARYRDGACALCFVTLNGHGWCANAGDCRAVMSRHEGHVERLSTDHKASEPEETARIEACGAEVEFGCLDGDLEVSRGLGDFDYCPAFSQEPAVMGPIDLRWSDGLVVLASDGIWDVVSDAEACTRLRAELDRGATADEACETLLELAEARGNGDDKTVVLLCLRGAVNGTAAAAPACASAGSSSDSRTKSVSNARGMKRTSAEERDTPTPKR